MCASILASNSDKNTSRLLVSIGMLIRHEALLCGANDHLLLVIIQCMSNLMTLINKENYKIDVLKYFQFNKSIMCNYFHC